MAYGGGVQRDDVGWQCASVWPGVAWRGVAELSARYITATFGQALWLLSLFLSFFSLPPSTLFTLTPFRFGLG